MLRPYKRYVPQNISELIDFLTGIVAISPKFIDRTGHFPHKSIDTEFGALNDSLELNRGQLGEECYLKLREMSDRIRAHFEADPDVTTGDTVKGCQMIWEMEDVLISVVRRPK
jgi:hypothetical protein